MSILAWMNGWNARCLCNWTPIHSWVPSSIICSLETLTECLLWIPFCLSALQSHGSLPWLSYAPSYLKAFPYSLSSAWGHLSYITLIPYWDLSSNLAFSELGLLTIPTYTLSQLEIELSLKHSKPLNYFTRSVCVDPLNCKPRQGSSHTCVSQHSAKHIMSVRSMCPGELSAEAQTEWMNRCWAWFRFLLAALSVFWKKLD